MRIEPWPWIVAGCLLSMIAISLSFAAVAHRRPDSLVVDDAYRAGLSWNDEQRARARGDAAGWRFDLEVRPERDAVWARVRLLDRDGVPLRPDRLELTRVRPSEGGYDRAFDAGEEGVRVPLPRPGRWHLVATARLGDRVLERVYRVER
jgi:nitrogen fixation protein FixH